MLVAELLRSSVGIAQRFRYRVALTSVRLATVVALLAAGVSGGEETPRGGASARAGTAWAWGPYTSEGMTLSERTPERFGWLFGGAGLYPYAEASAVYEDNLYLNSREEEDELYTVFSPGVTLVYGTPRGNHLYLDYSADFTSLEEEDGSAVDGQTLKAGGRFANARSQFEASHMYREVRDVDVEAGTRLKRKTHETTAGFARQVSSKTSAGVEGHHSLHQFEDKDFSGYRDYGVAGRLSWRMLPKADLVGKAGHGWVDVDEDRDAFGSAQYDEVKVGVSGRLRPRLRTSGDIGVQHRYFEDDNLDDITRWVGALRVSGEPFGRLHTWGAASGTLRPAVNADGYTVFDKRLEAGVSRPLFSERFVGGCSVWRGWSEYMGADGGNADRRVYHGREDDYWGFNANLDWWIGRYWSVGLGYSYMENDAAGDEDLPRGVDPSSYEAARWLLRVAFNR